RSPAHSRKRTRSLLYALVHIRPINTARNTALFPVHVRDRQYVFHGDRKIPRTPLHALLRGNVNGRPATQPSRFSDLPVYLPRKDTRVLPSPRDRYKTPINPSDP